MSNYLNILIRSKESSFVIETNNDVKQKKYCPRMSQIM